MIRERGEGGTNPQRQRYLEVTLEANRFGTCFAVYFIQVLGYFITVKNDGKKKWETFRMLWKEENREKESEEHRGGEERRVERVYVGVPYI